MTNAYTPDTHTDNPIGQDASAPAPSINLEPRQISNLDWYAAREAAAHRQGELPDPLWPGHILDKVTVREPNCTAYRADKLRRESVKTQLHPKADITEREESNTCEKLRWAPNPYFSIPIALGLICLFAWDWVRGLVGRIM